jgi:hypothetical protein
MTEQTAIESAAKRLALALDALEAAAERRVEASRADAQLAGRLHAADADRSRLTAELDTQMARSRALETANRDIARRLDAAIDNIRSVVETQVRQTQVS